MEFAKKMIEQSGLDVGFIVEDESSHHSPASYSTRENAVIFRPSILAKYMDVFKLFMPEEEVTQYILSHELGHAFDDAINSRMFELNLYFKVSMDKARNDFQLAKEFFKDYAKLKWDSERIAWKYAPRFFITTGNVENYERIKNQSLSTYRIGIQQEYQYLILTHKLHECLSSLHPFFHDDLTITPAFLENSLSVYNDQTHQLHVHFSHLFSQKPSYFKGLPKFEYVLYQLCYERTKHVHINGEHKDVNYFIQKAKEIDNQADFMRFLYRYEMDYLKTEESILEEVEKYFSSSSFLLFKEGCRKRSETQIEVDIEAFHTRYNLQQTPLFSI